MCRYFPNSFQRCGKRQTLVLTDSEEAGGQGVLGDRGQLWHRPRDQLGPGQAQGQGLHALQGHAEMRRSPQRNRLGHQK